MKAYKLKNELCWNRYHLIINEVLFYAYSDTNDGIDSFTHFDDDYRKENGFVECSVDEALKVLKTNIKSINKNIKL